MKHRVIAKRYAMALVNLAARRQHLEGLGQQLTRLQRAFACEPRLLKLLSSPTLDGTKKAGLLAGLSDYLQLDAELRSLLRLLQQRQRLDSFDALVDVCRQLIDARLGIVRARVDSAAPLEADTARAIEAVLERRFGGKAELDTHVDAQLLGGVRIEVAGQVLDGTLRAGLRRMAVYLNEEAFPGKHKG
jgi:F-type H+-transporting ATPase subunit delta